MVDVEEVEDKEKEEEVVDVEEMEDEEKEEEDPEMSPKMSKLF